MNPEERKQYIGGSDIAAIMGRSQFKSALALWAEKTGKIEPEDLSEVQHIKWGNKLEALVAEEFQETLGFKIRRDQRTFRHKKYDYMVGHIDRWIVGEDALLECKTTSAWNAKKWEGQEIPEQYILQVMWYLGIVGKKVGYIAVLIGGQKFLWKQIEFNQELFDKMVEAARLFWEENIKKNIPPFAVSGDEETLALLFSDVKESLAVLSEQEEQELDQLVEERQGGQEQKKLIEEDLSRIESRMKQLLGENEQALTKQYGVTWKLQRQTRADIDKLKEAGLFEEYSKTTEFRVLRTKQLRGL